MDISIVCKDCDTPFLFTANEQKFFASHDLEKPKRCRDCRAFRKNEKKIGVVYRTDAQLGR